MTEELQACRDHGRVAIPVPVCSAYSSVKEQDWTRAFPAPWSPSRYKMASHVADPPHFTSGVKPRSPSSPPRFHVSVEASREFYGQLQSLWTFDLKISCVRIHLKRYDLQTHIFFSVLLVLKSWTPFHVQQQRSLSGLCNSS